MVIQQALPITNPAYQIWIKTGYQQFALEGMEGLQVERLARILHRNKSGFYYYFGKRENYLEQILKFHLAQCEAMAIDLKRMTSFDPDFFNLMAMHKESVTVQTQLLRYRHFPFCLAYYEFSNTIMEKEIIPHWSAFIGIPSDPLLAHQLFGYTREMIYSRITPGSGANHELIKSLIYDVREMLQRLLEKGQQYPVLSTSKNSQ